MSTTRYAIDWLRSPARPQRSRSARWRRSAQRIVRDSEQLRDVDDAQLRKISGELRWHAQSGIDLRKVLPRAYALVREASQRSIGLAHFPVQIMGGIAMFEGDIAEMQTGEGKTITALLPAYLRGLSGDGCHLITVNDYLAGRDAETARPVFELLGMNVGCIQEQMQSDERRKQYVADVTYGTAKEIGFDFLRDKLRIGVGMNLDVGPSPLDAAGDGEPPVQRGHHFALVDEADSITIDEAKTPLIIGINRPNEPAEVSLYRWCDRVAHNLEAEKDFVYEPRRHTIFLTDAGCRKVVLQSKPQLIDSVETERIYKHVEMALSARYVFKRDRDYVVKEDEIVIVDESTGRTMEGRKWQDGLHHAVEAKERIPITAGTATAARITMQSFFRQYTHLAGMTGTAVQARGEIKRTYSLGVSPIPTHRPCIRKGLPPRIFATMEAKHHAVAQLIEQLTAERRSVLVGTPSVHASEALSAVLRAYRIAHQTLNAHYHEQEAEIVSQAGRDARVTIATNMAGRGTDITLSEEVRQAGGLHVIATEMHSSARIDRQLIGRAARQGDPGSYQFLLSFEDELLRCFPTRTVTRVRSQLAPDAKGQVSADWLWFFKKAQKTLERSHRKQRRDLLKHETQRNKLYRKMGLDPFLELTG